MKWTIAKHKKGCTEDVVERIPFAAENTFIYFC